MLEEDHYYPFGLTMAEISDKALKTQYTLNRHKYNGGNELQSQELTDGGGLEMYDAIHRFYDPQIGRFGQLDEFGEVTNAFSLYSFGSNNPVLRNDPQGLKDTTINGDVVHRDRDLTPAVVTHRHSDQAMQNTYWSLIHRGIPLDRVKDKGLRDWLLVYDAAQKGLERADQMQREFYSNVAEYGSWLLPVGELKIAGKVGKAAMKLFRFKRGMAAAEVAAKEGAQYLYHYTSKEAAESIAKEGLEVGRDGFAYLTEKGDLSPLQAQIELALPANRALPEAVLKIDASSLKAEMVRRVTGNMPGLGPGGGIEYLFTEKIPANLIEIIK